MADHRDVANGTTSPGLVPVAEHQERVAALMSPTRVDTCALEDCLGLALADDLAAPIRLPPFDNSAMDGYALRSEDVGAAEQGNPVALPVVEDIPAGRV